MTAATQNRSFPSTRSRKRDLVHNGGRKRTLRSLAQTAGRLFGAEKAANRGGYRYAEETSLEAKMTNDHRKQGSMRGARSRSRCFQVDISNRPSQGCGSCPRASPVPTGFQSTFARCTRRHQQDYLSQFPGRHFQPTFASCRVSSRCRYRLRGFQVDISNRRSQGHQAAQFGPDQTRVSKSTFPIDVRKARDGGKALRAQRVSKSTFPIDDRKRRARVPRCRNDPVSKSTFPIDDRKSLSSITLATCC